MYCSYYSVENVVNIVRELNRKDIHDMTICVIKRVLGNCQLLITEIKKLKLGYFVLKVQ